VTLISGLYGLIGIAIRRTALSRRLSDRVITQGLRRAARPFPESGRGSPVVVTDVGRTEHHSLVVNKGALVMERGNAKVESMTVRRRAAALAEVCYQRQKQHTRTRIAALKMLGKQLLLLYYYMNFMVWTDRRSPTMLPCTCAHIFIV